MFSPKTIEMLFDQQTFQVCYIQHGEGKPLLFLHGWGCDHTIMDPLMENLSDLGQIIAIDFPGFGKTTRPQNTWGTREYAEWLHHFMQQISIPNAYLICHSFGARVAYRLANQYPEEVQGLILIAAAGLKRNISWKRKWRVHTIRTVARLAQSFLPVSMGKKIKETLYDKIASRDYKNAGEMRNIFVNVVNEDLHELLPSIHHPTILIYGEKDQETPPHIGKTMHSLLPHSRYVELPEFDHGTILFNGRHQVGYQIRQFLKQIKQTESAHE